METGLDEIIIADVVASTAGRDQGKLFYVVGCEDEYVLLADGKGRPLESPSGKSGNIHVRSFALRPESPTS